MSNLLESVQRSFDNTYVDKLLESDKYEKLNAFDASVMRKLFENTRRDAIAQVNEGTLTADVAQFTPIVLPMVRRIFPQLIANHLLGIQPMSTPTGFMYALVNQYLGNSIKKVDDRTRPAGLIYAFSDSVGEQISELKRDGSIQVGVTKIFQVNSDGTDVEFGTVLHIEEDKVLASSINGTGIPAKANDIRFVNVADDGTKTDVLSVKFIGTYSNESSFYHILHNYTGTYSTYDAERLGNDMNEVGFSIDRKAVEVKSRAIKGKYTVEMYQDLKSQHGLTADQELMNLMQYEIQADLDREIVNFVKDNSTWVFDSPVGFGDQTNMQIPMGRWEIERYRAQVIRIAKESAIIGLETKRGQGNTLLVSPMVATMLEQVGTFQKAPVQSSVKQPISGGVAGTFDNRYNVIVDQYAKDDYCTVLYKGPNSRDAMGVYMPYVPLTFTKVTDYEKGQPVLIAKTRYALTTIPGVESADSNDRAKTYARSFNVNFDNTILARDTTIVGLN